MTDLSDMTDLFTLSDEQSIREIVEDFDSNADIGDDFCEFMAVQLATWFELHIKEHRELLLKLAKVEKERGEWKQAAMLRPKCAGCNGTGQEARPGALGYRTCEACNGKGY